MEMESARRDLEALGAERGQISLTFESVTETLHRVEAEIASLRGEIESGRAEEQAARRHADQLRAEHATLSGRTASLEALIREHSYSTDTVRKLFQSHSLGGGLAPVGTLADFLEVGDQYESVVDEFLREELNYIVVKSWDSAHEGVRLLKTGVDGRATFLVHPEDSQAKFSFAADDSAPYEHARPAVVPLRNCIRVLDGFGRSLEAILPKLREGYVAPDSETARSLALENPSAFFLAPTGECFHNVTVTGGKPGSEGPLALKRELRDTQQKLAEIERELGAGGNARGHADEDAGGADEDAGCEVGRAARGRAGEREPERGAAADGDGGAAAGAAAAGLDAGERAQSRRARDEGSAAGAAARGAGAAGGRASGGGGWTGNAAAVGE